MQNNLVLVALVAGFLVIAAIAGVYFYGLAVDAPSDGGVVDDSPNSRGGRGNRGDRTGDGGADDGSNDGTGNGNDGTGDDTGDDGTGDGGGISPGGEVFVLPIEEQNSKLPSSNQFNVSYGSAGNQTLDLYVGDKYETTFIVFLHGGGFTGGFKETFTPISEWMASLGYPVANINYRLPASYVTGGEDILTALNFLEDGYGAKRFILGGHSAGATLAMSVALSQNENPPYSVNYPSGEIVGVIGSAGLYDYKYVGAQGFDEYTQTYAAGSDPDEVNPINLADSGDDFKTILLVGENDTLAASQDDEDLAQKLPNAIVYIISGAIHNDVFRNDSGPGDPEWSYLEDFLTGS